LLAIASLAPAQISWAPSLDAARSDAKKRNRLVLTVFLSDSAPSRQFEDTTLRHKEIVARVSASYAPVRIETDREGALAKKHGVRLFPTCIVSDSRGEEAGRIEGFAWAVMFRDELQKIESSFREWSAIRAQYASNPRGGESNAKMAWALAIRHKRDEAERHLATARRAGYRGAYLAKAHNMIGDLYQFGEDFKKAIWYFRQADSSTKDTADRSYSKVSIMSCMLMSGDTEGARKVAKELVDLPGATKEYVDLAKGVLKREPRRKPAPPPR
jgi:hypothetical protein